MVKRTERTEFDMLRCPSCESTHVITSHEAQHLPCGTGNEIAIIVFVAPIRRCLACKLAFTDHMAEKAQEEALDRYRRILAPREEVQMSEEHGMWLFDKWIAARGGDPASFNSNDRYNWWLGYFAGINRRFWPPLRPTEAGEGIEPPTTGA